MATTTTNPTPLFTIPIPAIAKNAAGTIVCTSPAPLIYLLTITCPPDNRLTPASCAAFLTALDILELSPQLYPPGVVVTTSGIPKFYSNGLDLDLAFSIPSFLPHSLFALFRRFLTYPMPTVALLNGHAFAGGLMLAMHHDYRVMNPSKGFVCVNELEFGVPLKPAMSSIFRTKLPAATYRQLVLEAHRFGGAQAVEAGIADLVGGLEETVRFVEGRKLTGKAKSGIYGVLKAEMYRESVGLLGPGDHEREEERHRRLAVEDEERRRVGEERVEAWRREGGKKAKL
ncbi:ClpP/crotonase-like domain-containing protein [Bombardia bombarda]|uniref:ClpP/crotonase-like domain-containing protein n=1 Tax=Bombardia bombarda TaxID=252184 RepID=A0AA39W4Y2_9PEZI|nr:ClpP/crotonase-like domain-containing protein [Bombardia bombarda]